MIRLLLDKAGSGKTKKMIEMANNEVANVKGELVFIERHNKHIYDLDRNIRLISTKDFELNDLNSFYGFLCGLISENYDIEKIYVDGVKKIVKNSDDFEAFSESIQKISDKHNIDIIMSITTESEITSHKLAAYAL